MLSIKLFRLVFCIFGSIEKPKRSVSVHTVEAKQLKGAQA
jgi:hypothetical protein